MGKMLDSYEPDVLAQDAAQLAADGYTAAAFYLFESSAFKRPLTRAESVRFSKAGLYLVSVYENGRPTSASYFDAEKGAYDGGIGHERAVVAGQPAGKALYFAVDYDAVVADLARIDAYFDAVNARLRAAGSYAETGAYGNGLVCAHLTAHRRVTKTWLAGADHWSGYDYWRPKADIVQGTPTTVCGVDVDPDTTNGAAGGWQVFA